MKYIIILLFGVVSTLSHSDEAWKESNIDWVYPQANGSFAITLKDSSPSCTHAGGYHYVKVGENTVTQEGANNMYSLALLAATTGKKIKINFNPDSTACFVNRMYVVF